MCDFDLSHFLERILCVHFLHFAFDATIYYEFPKKRSFCDFALQGSVLLVNTMTRYSYVRTIQNKCLAALSKVGQKRKEHVIYRNICVLL